MKTFRLGLEWFLNPDHLPFILGQERGWFLELGIELELIEPSDHLDAFAAIERGEMDAAITEPIHLVEDRAKGRDVVGFSRFLHTNGGVMYLGGSGIERPRDMAQKRLQYPGAPGPGGPAIVRTMIEADGGPPSAELTPVDNGFLHTAALVEGKADLATLVFYNFEVVEARHLGHDARFFALKDWGVPDFCQLILVTRPQAIERDPGLFKDVQRVLARGLDFIHQQPDEAREAYFRRTGADLTDPLMTQIFRSTVPCFTFDFDMPERYYRALVEWMRERALIDAAIDPEACFRPLG